VAGFASPAAGFSPPEVAAASASEFAGRRHTGNVVRMPALETFPKNLIPIPFKYSAKVFPKRRQGDYPSFGIHFTFFAPA